MKTDLLKLFKKGFTFSKLDKIEEAAKRMTLTEKLVFYGFATLLILSTIFMLWRVNNLLLVEVPKEGGELKEGIIGTPRFINPLLAFTDADRDLTTLVYSGLLKATSDGNYIPDLAETYSVSEDGLKYTFTIRKDAVFHDGKPVTADDVIFTIGKATDPLLKSSKRPSWEGVNVRKLSDKEIQFVIREPYAPFLENATLGILPKHIWEHVASDQFPFSEYNIKPVGSGPYEVTNLKRDSGGLPVYYQLEPFSDYTLGSPFIKDIYINIYTSEADLVKAYKDGKIHSLSGISPQYATVLKKDGAPIVNSYLPRVFGVFFNQNKASVLSNKAVRQALDIGLDKEKIVGTVLLGYGVAIDSPIPPELLKNGSISEKEANQDRIKAAKEILENDGWKLNSSTGIYEKKTKSQTEVLKFSISTSNAPELKQVAELVKEEWRKIGVDVEVLVFEQGDLNQNIITPRDYQALLFGEIVGRDLDFYPFWHSSGRNYPGLNIALYTNSKVDKLLEDARKIQGKGARVAKYEEFETEVKNDVPAVFIYSPEFIYIIPEKIKGVSLGQLTIPAERFLNIHDWYIETENVWRIFVPKN